MIDFTKNIGRHIWSCSKFADWVRGSPKPLSAGYEEWCAWEKSAQTKKIRYWLAEDGLDGLQDIVEWPLKFFKRSCRYFYLRYIAKSHALTSSLKRGDYHEFETRMLHALFDELVNFVEIEEDITHLEWAKELKYDEEICNKDDPKFGKPTPQALAAQEILELYHWWKDQRPKRPDPYDASGEREFWDNYGAWDDQFDDALRPFRQATRKIEDQQYDEDTEMLIRLVKLRTDIWT